MTDKVKLVIVGALVAIAFIAGKSSNPTKTIVKLEEKIVYKESEVKVEKRNVKTTKKPDGTIEILDTSTLESLLVSQMDSEKKTETIKQNSDSVHVQALMSYKDNQIQYGGAIYKQIIGPLTLGAFGFTDLRFGVSVGVEL